METLNSCLIENQSTKVQTVSSSDEKEWLLLLKQGNEQAFEEIYNLYSSRLFGNIYRMVKSESTTQEILQDTFLKIWYNRASIDLDKSFRSYLFRIAENKVYDFFRKTTRDKKIRAQFQKNSRYRSIKKFHSPNHQFGQLKFEPGIKGNF